MQPGDIPRQANDDPADSVRTRIRKYADFSGRATRAER